MKAVEELKAALAAATPGEWFARKGDTFNPERTYGIVRVLSPDEHGCDPEDGERTEVIAEVFDTAHDEGHADAHLIALMHNTLPTLIECAEALKDVLSIDCHLPEHREAVKSVARTALANLENMK